VTDQDVERSGDAANGIEHDEQPEDHRHSDEAKQPARALVGLAGQTQLGGRDLLRLHRAEPLDAVEQIIDRAARLHRDLARRLDAPEIGEAVRQCV
jgi:hypothetical protein